jgi:hypothetical protein
MKDIISGSLNPNRESLYGGMADGARNAANHVSLDRILSHSWATPNQESMYERQQATASKMYRNEILISRVFDSAEAREGKKPK